MDKTLIQKHSSAIFRGLLEKLKSLSELDHKLTKGELRELFVSEILQRFLTNQFSIGSGIIINQKGTQSSQTDIIIYDNRILPPFIKEQHLGVYPAESVLATIEVKSYLAKKEVIKAEEAARKLNKQVFNPNSSLYGDYKYFKPLCGVIGFYGNGVEELKHEVSGKNWLNKNIKSLFGICLTGKYTWLNIFSKGWGQRIYNPMTVEEIKRFIFVILDNVRTHSELRLQMMGQYHRDLLSIYMRDQEIFKQ